MKYTNNLEIKSRTELRNQMRTLEDYVRMVTGMDLEIGLSVKSHNSVEVHNTLPNFSELVKSWCNYYNCIGDTEYILICKSTDNNVSSVSIEIKDSVGKNICYSNNDILLYKLFKRQLEPNGKYRKRTVGYMVEKADTLGTSHIKTFDCTQKKEAKRLYKKLVNENTCIN